MCKALLPRFCLVIVELLALTIVKIKSHKCLNVELLLQIQSDSLIICHKFKTGLEDVRRAIFTLVICSVQSNGLWTGAHHLTYFKIFQGPSRCNDKPDNGKNCALHMYYSCSTFFQVSSKPDETENGIQRTNSSAKSKDHNSAMPNLPEQRLHLAHLLLLIRMCATHK